MTHRRTTRLASIVLSIACTGLAGVSGQQANDKPSELVKLSAEYLGVQQCIQPKDDQTQDEHSKLRIRFTITNVSDQPLIIYRQAPAVFDFRIVRREIDFPKVPFNLDYRPTFNCAPILNFEGVAPGNDFQVLQPNESLTHVPEGLLFSGTTASERKRRFEGDYFVKLRVATWYWDVWKAEILEQRWIGNGRLFYSHLVTDPIAINFPKPDATTPRCDSVALK